MWTMNDFDGYGYGTLDLSKFLPTKTRGGQRILGDLIKIPLDILCRITGGIICFNKPPGGGGGGSGGGGGGGGSGGSGDGDGGGGDGGGGGGGGGDGGYTYEDM